MRGWIGCLFILLVSTICCASVPLVAFSKAAKPAILTIGNTSAIGYLDRSLHCDQLEDIEFITAAYQQSNGLAPVVLFSSVKLNIEIYPVTDILFVSSRNNTLIQPFYKLILFPFHTFW